jgi:putative tryptophan/tyrosine transport system substrate-binding protein
MRRRDFIAGLGAAAAPATWSSAVPAQRRPMLVIGYVSTLTPEADAGLLNAFRQALRDTGFVEGQNVVIDYRWAENRIDRLPQFVADLARRRVDVIVAPDELAALAAKPATTTIPIVFWSPGDPVQSGLVASINRPGGNLTGVATRSREFGGKRFGLLHEMLPRASRFAGLVDSNTAARDTTIQDAQAAALSLGLQMQILTAGTSDDIDTAFAMIAQMSPDALLVATSTLFLARRVRLATLAAYHRLPAIFGMREFVEAGGLMSYGASNEELYRQLGIYSGRILKGEKPSDLPVWQPTQFEFVINRGTAKTLGIEVPPQLLAIANDVIE